VRCLIYPVAGVIEGRCSDCDSEKVSWKALARDKPDTQLASAANENRLFNASLEVAGTTSTLCAHAAGITWQAAQKEKVFAVCASEAVIGSVDRVCLMPAITANC
jgi:hypothetical protein